MTITLSTNDLIADAADMLAALQGITGTGTGGGGTGTSGGTVDYFPSDAVLAPFPSPENSQIMVLNNMISGRPYLKDQSGAVHTIRLVSGVAQYFKGDQQFPVFPGETVSQCLVRQGEVYMQIGGGIWKHVDPNGTMYNANLPAAWTTGGGSSGTAPLPSLPAFPVPSQIAPGSSGNIIQAGTGQALATLGAALAVAVAGDTIQLAPGIYTEAPHAWTVPLKIDLGGATLAMDGQTVGLAHGKGCLVPCADSIVMNGTITGTAMDQTTGQLTSAIRPDDGCGYLTIQNMQLHGNQCGVGHGGFNCVIALQDCDISGNGLVENAGANTHNLYVGSECRRLTLTNVISNGCEDAHAIKYRGPEMIVNGGTFAASNGSCFDLPNGSTVPFTITGAVLNKGTDDPDHHVMGYGEEGASNGLAGGTINGGTINALCPSPFIATGGACTITAVGVAKTGNPVTATGGATLVGF